MCVLFQIQNEVLRNVHMGRNPVQVKPGHDRYDFHIMYLPTFAVICMQLLQNSYATTDVTVLRLLLFITPGFVHQGMVTNCVFIDS